MKPDQADGHYSAQAPSAMSQSAPSKALLGADLKAVRVGKDITLKQVSLDTRISLRHIQNLEEGRYNDLPGGMYNRAFLRTYCAYLGLEPAEFLDRYEKESAPQSEKIIKAKARSQTMPAQSFRVPPVMIWSVMLLASIVGLYFSRGWISAVFSPYFSHAPATRLPASQPAPPPNAPKPAETASPVPPTPTAATQAVPTEPVQAPGAAAPPPGIMRLKFEVVQECWMSLSSDGTRVLSRTLQPGETPFFDAKERIDLVVGNAGGVKLMINGKPAKPLGKPGAVVRLVITPQTIQEMLEK
ncbi:MAG: DUF4115 domain-containing protein [Acidobacteriia bacterium]|nr:DUF4115 domain-containing protein [Terriglobia bacterium]